MRILYISTAFPKENQSSTIYTDLAEALVENGHEVMVVASEEKKNNIETDLLHERGCKVLRVKTGNMYDVGLLEKGLSIITVNYYMKRAINKYLKKEQFDLVLFSTPPVTCVEIVNYVKKKYKIPAYLMLKDIFPQNAVDIGIMGKGIIYQYFRIKEKQLYRVADIIGCMSEENCRYVAKHNTVQKDKLTIFPNTKKINHFAMEKKSFEMRNKYKIPSERVVFVFGGNMGKPQGIPFLCKAIKELEKRNNAYFVLVGRGTEKAYVHQELEGCTNVLVLDNLPREEYEKLVRECNVGIVSLDYRFTIPNYPSRILSYMEYSMPVLACTDKNTDFKALIENSGCGVWCYSNAIEDFFDAVQQLSESEEMRLRMGAAGRKYIEENFEVQRSVKLLEEHIRNYSENIAMPVEDKT